MAPVKLFRLIVCFVLTFSMLEVGVMQCWLDEDRPGYDWEKEKDSSEKDEEEKRENDESRSEYDGDGFPYNYTLSLARYHKIAGQSAGGNAIASLPRKRLFILNCCWLHYS